MHPEDMRNMFIFVILAAILYFAYNTYVLQPQAEAMKAAEQQATQTATANAPAVPAAQDLKPLTRSEALNAASERRIKINNDAIFGTISTKGGVLDDLALHNYYETLEKKDNVVLLSPKRAEFPREIEHGFVASDKSVRLPDENTIWSVRGNNSLTPGNPITLTWNNGAGLTFERTIAIDDQFLFTFTQKVTNNSGSPVTLYPYGLINQKWVPPYFASTWISHEGPIGYIGEELQQPSYNDLKKGTDQSFTANKGWLGITDKYWLLALMPPQDKEAKYRYSYAGDRKNKKDEGRFQADFLGSAMTIAPGASESVESNTYVGAKRVLVLNEYAEKLEVPRLDLAVDFGWLWFMSIPFFYILHYAGELVGNFGVAILILTLVLRGVTFPLTNLSYKSFAKMKKVGPQIVELREKYGDDKQKLQQELVQMYQREGVNPMAGCFPILLQIPIFFALYKVLFVTIEMRHAPFFGWIQDLSAPDPTSIFNLFGLIPWDPPSFLMIGVWPCVMLLAMIVQKKLNPPPQDKLQRDIANYMPFMFAFIMSQFAAGLVVYWSFSAIIGIIQQIIIMRRMDVPIHLFGETDDEKKMDEAIDKGPDVHPIAEMAEDDVEEALFGKDEEPKKISPPKPKKSKKKKK